MHRWSWLLGDHGSTLQAAIYKLLFTPSFSLFPFHSLLFFLFQLYADLLYCLIILSPTIWQTKREDRAKMNRLTKREEACNTEKHSSFLLFVQKDGGKHEEVKKKVKAIDFLFFIVLLDLCHTSGSSKMRRSHLIPIFHFYYLDPNSLFLPAFPLVLHYPVSVSLCPARFLSSSVFTALPSCHLQPLLPVYIFFSLTAVPGGAWGI